MGNSYQENKKNKEMFNTDNVLECAIKMLKIEAGVRNGKQDTIKLPTTWKFEGFGGEHWNAKTFLHLTVIVAKKWEPRIPVPSRFSAQIRKVEARLGKLAKIRKVETQIRKVHLKDKENWR